MGKGVTCTTWYILGLISGTPHYLFFFFFIVLKFSNLANQNHKDSEEKVSDRKSYTF